MESHIQCLCRLSKRKFSFTSAEFRRNLIESRPRLLRYPSVLNHVFLDNQRDFIEYSDLDVLRYPASVTMFYLVTFYLCVTLRILRDEGRVFGSNFMPYQEIPFDLIIGGTLPISNATFQRDLFTADDPVTLDLLRAKFLYLSSQILPILKNNTIQDDAIYNWKDCDDVSHVESLANSSHFWKKSFEFAFNSDPECPSIQQRGVLTLDRLNRNFIS